MSASAAYHAYMGMFAMMFVGIGIGWAAGSLTPARHGWTPFVLLAFWIAAGIGVANVPEAWMLAGAAQ